MKSIEKILQEISLDSKYKKFSVIQKNGEFLYCDCTIVKENGFYNIYKNKELFIKNISCFDAATSLIYMNYINKKRYQNDILREDYKYYRCLNDLTVFNNILKNINEERKFIIENKRDEEILKIKTIREKIIRIRNLI